MIKCKRFVFFKNAERSTIAVHIECTLFTATFYLDNEVEWVNGSFYDEETGGQKVEMKLKNDRDPMKFLMNEVEWVTLKTYKDQIIELL